MDAQVDKEALDAQVRERREREARERTEAQAAASEALLYQSHLLGAAGAAAQARAEQERGIAAYRRQQEVGGRMPRAEQGSACCACGRRVGSAVRAPHGHPNPRR